MEMVVADNHIAESWQGVLENLKIHYNYPLVENGQIGWATRPNSTQLLEQLNRFASDQSDNQRRDKELFERYYRSTRWIGSPLEPQNLETLGHLVELFTHYAGQYGLDWIELAALAYQASNLDHSRKGSNGTIGIMQVRPEVTELPEIKIRNIHDLENNIQVAAKYLRYLRHNYFADNRIPVEDQQFFSWAGV